MYGLPRPEAPDSPGPAGQQGRSGRTSASPQFGDTDPRISPSSTRGRHPSIGSPVRNAGASTRRTPGAELQQRPPPPIGDSSSAQASLVQVFQGLDIGRARDGTRLAVPGNQQSLFEMVWEASPPLPSELYSGHHSHTLAAREPATDSSRVSMSSVRPISEAAPAFPTSLSYSPSSERYSIWGRPAAHPQQEQHMTASSKTDFVESAYQRHVRSMEQDVAQAKAADRAPTRAAIGGSSSGPRRSGPVAAAVRDGDGASTGAGSLGWRGGGTGTAALWPVRSAHG